MNLSPVSLFWFPCASLAKLYAFSTIIHCSELRYDFAIFLKFLY